MRGFSTIEIVIALGILSTTLAAVVMVSFGSQALLEEGEMNAEALQKAQEVLEQEAANARKDFKLVHTIAATQDGAYQTSATVSMWPGDPYTTKRIEAIASWQDERSVSHSVTLTQLVSDFSDPTTLDTSEPSLSGDWTHPRSTDRIFASGDLLSSSAPSGYTFSTTNTIGAIDAYHGMLYVATAATASAHSDSLFIFDISNPIDPRYRGSIDNNSASTKGMNAVAGVGGYAYAANAFGSNFKTCKIGANCAQLQIFDVTDPTSIASPINFLIPTSSPPYVYGTGGQAAGKTLFYADGYLYVGLTKTAHGPEFNIIDVHDPHNPHWLGGYQVGNSINQIYVRNGFAYLASDDKSRELLVLDVHDPSAPTPVSFFDPSGTLGYETGQSMYLIGDTVYLGMGAAGGFPELYVLDIAHPTAPASTGSRVIGSTILGMFADNKLAYLLASTIQQFQILDVSDPTSIAPYASAITLPGTVAALDCEGNYFYVGSNNGATGNVSIISPTL